MLKQLSKCLLIYRDEEDSDDDAALLEQIMAESYASQKLSTGLSVVKEHSIEEASALSSHPKHHSKCGESLNFHSGEHSPL